MHLSLEMGVPTLIRQCLLCLCLCVFWISPTTCLSRSRGSTVEVKNGTQHVMQAVELEAFLTNKLRLFKRDLVQNILIEQSHQMKKIYEAKLVVSNISELHQLQTSLEVMHVSKNLYSVQSDGIYQLTRQVGQELSILETSNRVARMDGWDATLAVVHEWNGIYFLLIATNGYSYIYTLDANFNLVLRQSIKNVNVVKAATFFMAGDYLFLVLADGNRYRDLSKTEIYKWSGTYMDEIHEVVTKGAAALATFENSGHQYILIAQDHSENPEVGTQVWKLNHITLTLEKVQLLPSNAPVAVATYKMAKEHFAVIGNNLDYSMIFWWEGSQFVQWQILENMTGSYMNFDALEFDNGQVFLLVTKRDVVYLYKKSSSQLVLTLQHHLPVDMIQKANFHYVNKEHYIIINALENGQPKVLFLPLSIVAHKIEDALGLEKDPLLRIMLQLSQKLEDRKAKIDFLKEQMQQIVRCNSNVTYNGTLKIRKVNLKQGHVSNLQISPMKVHLEETASLLEQRILEAVEKAKKNVGALDTLVYKTLPGQINGNVVINGQLSATIASIKGIVTKEINSLAWNTLIRGVLLQKGEEQTLTGVISLDEVSIRDMHVKKLSGAELSDYMRRYLDEFVQNVTGKHTMLKDLHVESSLSLGDVPTINGISLDNVVMNNRGPMSIAGVKTMRNLFVNGNVATRLLNGHAFQDWFNDAVSIADVEQAVGELIFLKDTDIEQLSVINLNGRNFDHFMNSVVMHGKDQVIIDFINYNIVVIKSLQAKLINGIPIDHLLTTVVNQHVRSNITVKNVKVNGDLITKTVNGINLDKDVAIASANNSLKSLVKFNNLTAAQVSMNESTTLNGLDFSEAGKLKKCQIYYTKAVEFHKSLKVKNVVIPRVNRTTVDAILSDYWRLHSSQTILVPVHVSGSVTIIGNVSAHSLNLLHLQNDLLHASGNQSLNSLVKFDQVLVVKDMMLGPRATINGSDVSEMDLKAVKNTGVFHVDGLKTFVGGLFLPNGANINALNDLKIPNDIVLCNETFQELGGTKGFHHLKVEYLNVETNVSVDTVNGISLAKMKLKSVMIDEPTSIAGHVRLNRLTAPTVHVVSTANGVDWNIFKDTVYLTSNLSLSNGMQVLGNVDYLGKLDVAILNGMPFTEHLNLVVSKAEDTKIFGLKEMNSVKVKGDLGTPMVNNVDLSQVEHSVLSRSKNQSLNVPVVIQNMFANNLYADVIDKVHIDNIAVTTQTASLRNIKFDNVTVESDVLIFGKINDCDINKGAHGLFQLNGRMLHDLEIDGSVTWKMSKHDRKQLSYIIANAVSSAKDEAIVGRTMFDSIVLHNITSEKWINGVNLQVILEDALYKTGDQTIVASKSFGDLAVAFAMVQNDTGMEINGLNLDDLAKILITTTGDHIVHGRKTFNSLMVQHLLVEDTIDGILVGNLVTTMDDTVVPRVQMQDLVVEGGFEFAGMNGFSLFDLLEQRLTLSKLEIIQGYIEFEDDVNITGNVQASRINVDLDNLVFVSAGSQVTITGQKSFDGLRVMGDINVESVNSKSIEDLQLRTLKIDEDETIPRTLMLDAIVEIGGDVTLAETVDDIVVKNLPRRLNELIEEFHAKLQPSLKTSLEFKQKLQASFGMLKDMPSEFEYLEEYVNLKYAGVEHVSYMITDYGILITLNQKREGECGLPPGCTCPVQTQLEMNDMGIARELTLLDGVRHYAIRLPQTTVHVSTNAVSYGKGCVAQTRAHRERTMISAEPPVPYGGLVDLSNPSSESGSLIVDEERSGYISDVVAFHYSGTTYVVLAIYFDRERDSYNVNSLVKGIENMNMALVHEIPTRGACCLSLIRLDDETVHLAIVNTIPSNGSTFSLSEIHAFVPEEKRFAILRTVNTMGAQNVVSLQVDLNVFVVFSQQAPVASHHHNTEPVQIYAYKKEVSNYYLYQSLYLAEAVVHVSTFKIQDDAFLAVVTEGSMVHLFKYGFTMGFHKAVRFTIEGIQKIFPMYSNNGIYLLAATKNDSKLLNAQWMGRKP